MTRFEVICIIKAWNKRQFNLFLVLLLIFPQWLQAFQHTYFITITAISASVSGQKIPAKRQDFLKTQHFLKMLTKIEPVMTQQDEDCSFLDYKIALKSFEENERYCHGTVCEKDTIMQLKPRTCNPKRNIICHTCGEPSHKSSVTSTRDKAMATRASVSGVITVKAQHI